MLPIRALRCSRYLVIWRSDYLSGHVLIGEPARGTTEFEGSE
jgi:hypothetical protein